MDNAGPDGAISKKSLAVVILQRVKSHEVCTVLLDKGLFLKNRTTLLKKNAPSYVENCRSGLSLVPLGCSAGQILVQKSTKFDRPRQTVPTR